MTAHTFKLETQRLFLRNLTIDDKEAFFRLNQDPEVLRYTGDAPFEDVAQAAAFLSGYDQYSRYGYGRWAVVLKESGQFIGWCGLKYTPENGETDLGFRFFREYWGQGFATEAARACLQYAFDVLRLPVVVGGLKKKTKLPSECWRKSG